MNKNTYYVEPLSLSDESKLYPIMVKAENKELARQAACEYFNIPAGYRNCGLFAATESGSELDTFRMEYTQPTE